MSLPISAVQTISSVIQDIASPVGVGSSPGLFQSTLDDAVSKVETLEQNAAESVNKFLSGEGGEIHQVALALHESQSAFEMFLQVRNKVTSAYQEIMRMQL